MELKFQCDYFGAYIAGINFVLGRLMVMLLI